MSAITAIEAPRPARAPAWAWLRPSLLDFLFVALLLWLIGYTATGGTAGLLQDAGTGYHIRVGDLILRTRAIPHTDVFSFTRAGQPWYAWEWLSGVLFAILNGLAGLKGVVLFSAALIAATVVTLVRHMVWRGANALVALFLAHIGIAVSSLHFLARPHLFTFFFLALSLFVIDMDRAAPSRRIYWLLPMTVLWVNLHGGFIALPASLACLATGYLVAAVRGAAGARASAKRYGLLFGACLLVSGLNPFGFTEHVHIARYMNAGWIRQLVLEFQPPKFDGAQGFYAEALVLGAAVLAFRLLTRGDFAHAFLIALWTHAALHSVRHLPLLAIVVLPLAATEAQDAWRHIVRNAPRGSIRATLASVAADHTPGLTRISILPLTAVAAIAATSAMPFPTHFPEPRYPVSVVNRHYDLLERSRVFSTDSYGDYLTYRLYPHGRVFIDGRSDMYGPRLADEYLAVLNGAKGWDAVLSRYNVDAVLVPSGCAAATLLRGSSGWTTLQDDSEFSLFQRAKAR